MNQTDAKVVLIGGGSGTAAIYPALVEWAPNTTGIISMSDSGGSTGEISRALGLPAVGDLGNVLSAASPIEEVREMSAHRYGGDGPLRIHSLRNMVMAAYVQTYGLSKGVKKVSRVWQVPGRILPVTLEPHTLVMQDGDDQLRGEHVIDGHKTASSDSRVWLEPEVTANPEATEAIDNSDLIVIAPGSIYTSILAAAKSGIEGALKRSRAPKVLMANLATEELQTNGWHVVDYLRALARHGISVDYVLYNNEDPSQEMSRLYEAKGQRPVDYSGELFDQFPGVQAIGAALLSSAEIVINPDDPIQHRSLMRHDSEVAIGALARILETHQTRAS